MSSTQTQTDVDTALRIPHLWVCKMLNDDFTPMDFVIELLMSLFNKNPDEAQQLTMEIHLKGSAIVGTYTKDIAVTKARRACERAESMNHPLRTIAEQI